MRTLLLNSPAGHAPRAFLDQKTKRSDQVPFLVDHHHLAETDTLQQQATVVKFKKILSKMLTIMTMRAAFAPFSKK